MKQQIPLLENKIANLELINKSWERTDSIRNTNEEVLTKKNKKLSKQTKLLSAVAILAIIWSVIK